jgi:hypothetical protein
MDTPTRRRDLLKYAVGATLASTLPVSCCHSPTDTNRKPLAVDLIGPMGFTMGKNPAGDAYVDVWMPTLLSLPHLAGIVTSMTVIPLHKKDYEITGPTRFSGTNPEPYSISKCTVYRDHAQQDPDLSPYKFIRLRLPMPHYIVPLNPVPARIYGASTNSRLPATCTPYAVGLRFLYDETGDPRLTPSEGTVGIIPLDVAPYEPQVNMSIVYSPSDSTGSTQAAAIQVFDEISSLFGLNVKVDFGTAEPQCKERSGSEKATDNPIRPCKAPIALLR